MTLRVVLDANVYLSGMATLPFGTSAPPTILRRWYAGSFDVVISSAILSEIRSALSKPYFQDAALRIRADDLLMDLELAADVVQLDGSVTGVATHRHDDRIIETAVHGAAHYLVTGDKELLGVKHPYRFRILHPNNFLLTLDDDPPSR
jgi:uncharacterized protein